MKLSHQIIAAALLAVILGPVIGEASWMKWIGDVFINLLKMVAVPLVFVSIAGAFSKARGGHPFLYVLHLLFMASLCFFGVMTGKYVMDRFVISGIPVGDTVSAEPQPLTDVLLHVIPSNPAAAFADGNMLQIIFLSILIGLAASKEESVQSFFDISQRLCMKVAGWVMKTAPVGIFALVYEMSAKDVGNLLQGYAYVASALFIGILITFLYTVALMYFMNGAELRRFLSVVLPGDFVGAVSGGATNYMAPRMQAIKSYTDISTECVDMWIPFTSVVMRLGSCVCVGVYSSFAAGVFGASPDWLLFPFIALLALMAAPGIIGGTLMDCVIIWSAIGIPVEAVALFAGFDYFMDVMRTTLNIFGGEAVTYIASPGKDER